VPVAECAKLEFTTVISRVASRLGSAFINIAPHGVQDGRFVAIDTETGKVGMGEDDRSAAHGGALATAVNLPFFDEGNGEPRAGLGMSESVQT
jgi:hypothetical protein